MDIFEGLNPEQRRAVEHTSGPLLVVAGAGTGKTQVITRRIAALIAHGRAKPGEVLALTFTEKAAREMADRLYELIGWESFSVPVMTFNAFGAELLVQYAHHIGRSVQGGLINDTQKALLLKQRLDRISYEYYTLQADWYEFAVQLVAYISKLQNAGVTADRYREYVDGLTTNPGDLQPGDVSEQRDLARIYELYEQMKQETATYDYYDQLAVPVAVMVARPNLAERLGRQYRFVLVDEYQDTSPVQDALLRQLIGPGGNVFAVGDDDQAIYGFRGADIANILDFTAHFRVEMPVVLIQNYRSGQPILDAAYRLITHNNPERLEAKLGLNKRLVAQTQAGSVDFTPYRTAMDEQTQIIAAIERRLAAGETASGIAVLARSNATLQAYAKALRARQLPFAVSTAINIFEQHELVQLWYLLEWIGGRAKDEAIGHVMVGPLVGWSASWWRSVVERAAADLTGVETALRSIADEGEEVAIVACRRLDTWREWAQRETATKLVVRVITEAALTGDEPLVERLQRLAREKGREQRVMRVVEDLQRLLGHIDDFTDIQELSGGDRSLAGYLMAFPRPPRIEVDTATGDEAGVQLLTVHASKGLEFETVYIVNATARAWSEQPVRGWIVPPELVPPSVLPAVHEQRRLMYVAITRARRELFLSAPIQTAGAQKQAISPLVAEVLGHDPELKVERPSGETIEDSLNKLQRYYPLMEQLPDRLPFETADGWLELGVGDLENYQRSPHDFYVEKVLGLVRPFGPQLAFGAAIHKAIERFYKARLERHEPSSLTDLVICLDEQWRDHGYETRVQAEAAHALARQTIERFYEREMAQLREVQSSEQAIRFEVPEAKLRLRGRIDATFKVDGGIEIRDFKTGNQRDAAKIADKAKTSFQLRTYALALEALSGRPPAQVTLDYVVTGVEGSAELTSLILKNHRKKLAELAQRLRVRDFSPGSASVFQPAAAFKYYGESDEPEVIND